MLVTGGSTSVSAYLQMRLLAGGDATGLTITDFDMTYTRSGAAPSAKVDCGDLGSANAAWNDDNGYEVDPTDAPGLHRFDFPDAAFAAGVREVLLTIKHTSCFTESLRVTIDAEVNVTRISDDSAAADNLEATFDSTGYVDDDAPATQAQLGQISLTGAAVSTPAKDSPNGFSIVFGENEANNEDSTHEVDGTYHDIEAQDDGGTEKIDVYYEFDVGGDGVPTSVSWEGYLTSGGGQPKNITVQAYNWTTWDQIGSISSGGSNVSETFSLFTSHVGTGANLGLVRIKFVTGSVAFTATTTLKTDRIFLSYAIVRRSVGYANGAIWVDTSASNTNTENYVDGTADNPVSTWAAALTLSSQMNIDQFHIANGSTITLSAASDGYTMFGDNWTLALNSKSIAGSHFQGASVSGIATGATAPDFHDCRLGAVTLPPCKLYNCGIGVGDGLFTGGTAGDYLFLYCFSVVAGSGTPDFDFTGAGAAVGINNRAWTGGASYTLDSDCTMSHEVLAGGGTTVTTGGASVEIRGITSSVTLVLSGAGTVQFVGITGPVTISGTATTTVNLYGHATSLADSSSGTTVNDLTVQLDSSGYTRISDGNGIGQVALTSGAVILHTDYDAAKAAASAAAVNSEVSDVMKTDVIAEMAAQAPPITPTFEEAVMYLYMAFRNANTATASQRSIKNDAGAVIAKGTLSDDGSTFDQGKLETGP